MATELTNSKNPLSCEGGSTLLHRSCHDCNRRKVRCNKESPCDNCVRLGVECTYPPPGRKPRKTPRKPSKKSELLSRLSILEREVQKLGGQSQSGAPPTDVLEDQDRHKDSENSWNVNSWLAENLAADQSTEPDEHDSETRGELLSPQENSITLDDQFGRLVLDRNNGTSRYVNNRVLTELADQVYYALHKY